MSPRENLLDRIDQLRELATTDRPDAETINDLISDIRAYFAGIGATHCPPARQPGVSAGTREDAERLYGGA